jgi:hypothetical protein
MEKRTYGQSFKREIDDEEDLLEQLSIKYGMNSFEYHQAAQKFYARKKQLAEADAKSGAKHEVSRG